MSDRLSAASSSPRARATARRTALRRPTTLLGGLSPQTFMTEYWQKAPLLIRQAAPEYIDRFPVDDLFELAGDDDVESRLVTRTRGRWKLRRGPFADDARAALPPRDWSLLVQGVNLYDDDAAALLERFRFIPDARLDDLMISYAPDGGGVGPHFDSYDVFLLQTHGRRRWRISQQRDLSLDPRQPMKILSRFVAEQEWILEPGDMLYLPPHVAHEGVALGDCITCSIGFRAPSETELLSQFLQRMAERIGANEAAPVRYQDPEQDAVACPAALPPRLVAATLSLVESRRWGVDDVQRFLGSYLSEPKANVYFDPSPRATRRETFVRRCQARSLHLDPRTQMLYDEHRLYINGEPFDVASPRSRKVLFGMADERSLEPVDFVTLSNDSSIVSALFEWYLAGWIDLV
ncbi:cupin domain-containing protein [Robbsia sp. Bb-Pol-6]|uniref:Cupin domain-containing protein n=1 Tax=Robbsia betulipollinis TaxID=2981849 RepID=A0ABT3ZNJ9_9BURK|nr:cupin domain-containing protein [Robbsia betulipollinis]MCY0387887.1 cupin domain-containing protein [Robbsia betulipollinis]